MRRIVEQSICSWMLKCLTLSLNNFLVFAFDSEKRDGKYVKVCVGRLGYLRWDAFS